MSRALGSTNAPVLWRACDREESFTTSADRMCVPGEVAVWDSALQRLERKAAEVAGPPVPQTQLVPVEHIADDAADHCALIVAGGAADLMATGWALSRCPSCYEANPLGVNVEARIALKTGGMAGACWLSYRLERSGHHKAAKVFSRTWLGVALALTANNAYRALRRR